MKVTALTATLPFTFACWCRVGSITGSIMSLGETGTALACDVLPTSAGGQGFVTDYNGPNQAAFSAGAVTLNTWCYLIVRWITTTNRRIVSLRATGQVIHGNSTGSITTGTLARLSVGCRSVSTDTSFFNGDIAEFFYANGDIDPTNSGIALTDDFVRTLAFNGPFSFPHIVPLIQEYRSFRSMTTGVTGNSPYDYQPNEVYQKGGQRLWTTVGAPTLIDHPPLAGNYVRPGQNQLVLAC